MSEVPTTPVKPGYKTTEFWLSVVASAVGLVMASGLPSDNWIIKVAGIAAMVLSALGYTASRSTVKSA